MFDYSVGSQALLLSDLNNEDVEIMEFKQFVQIEFKQDSVHDFMMSTMDGNHIALLGSLYDVNTLKLTPNVSHLEKFPYDCITGKLTQVRPLSKLLDPVKLQSIYLNSDLLASQELALEPLYVEACTATPPEAKLVYALWSPKTLRNGQDLFAVLTSYGAFNLWTKEKRNAMWHEMPINLIQLIYESVVPPSGIEPRKINNFKDFKTYIDRFWITAFYWIDSPQHDIEEHELIAGTASGHLIYMKLNASADKLVSHHCSETNMGHICYIRIKNDLAIVGNAHGVVKLFKMSETQFEEVECLWKKVDRMGIQGAIITECPMNGNYFVLFTKAAHVLTFCVSREGKKCLNATLYLGGLKLSGLISLTANTFILTSINSLVHHLTLKANADNTQLEIANRLVQTNLDTVNFQIKGVTISRHLGLLCFLMYRCTEYSLHQDSITRHAVIVHVGKLTHLDPLKRLTESQIDDILDYADLLVAIHLDIINEWNVPKYLNHFQLTNVKLPVHFNEEFHKQLQIKYLVMKTLVQVTNEKGIRSSLLPEWCKWHLEFLMLSLEIMHILQRLQHLDSLRGKCTAFQQQVIDCMVNNYILLTKELNNLKNKEPKLEQTIDGFLELANKSWYGFDVITPEFSLDIQIEKANKGRKCLISYMPLELNLNSCYCTLCGRHVLPDLILLKELYAPTEKMRCIFCRSNLSYENVDEII